MFVPFRARAAALALAFSACAYPGTQAPRAHNQNLGFISSWQPDAPAATFAERSAALTRVDNRARGAESERSSFTWRAADDPRLENVEASYFAANRAVQPLGWPSTGETAR